MNDDPKKELKELSPLLSELRAANEGFEVPEGYFDQLQQEMLEKAIGPLEIERTNIAERPVILRVLKNHQARWIAIAASVLLLILAGWWFSKPDLRVDADQFALVEVSTEEANAYLDAHVEDYELALLVEELDQPMTNLQAPPALDPQMEELLEEIELDDLEEFF